MLIGSRLRRVHAGGEDGQALVLVVFLIFVLGLLSPLLMDTISATSKESNDSLVQAKAHAAAEAGINEYVAKLLNDTQYYAQYVAPGEATRQSGVNIVASVLPPAAPTAWTYGTTWTYPNGKDAWVDLGNGFSYDLEITPPQTGTNTTNFLLITATGKSNLSSDIANDRQVVQMLIRPASVADFQMFSAGSVCYGDGAITNGKIYTQGNLYFSGTAKADLNAEGNIYLPPTSAQGGDPCGTSGNNNTGTVVAAGGAVQPHQHPYRAGARDEAELLGVPGVARRHQAGRPVRQGDLSRQQPGQHVDDARVGVADHLQLERHGHLQVLQEDLQPGPVDPADV